MKNIKNVFIALSYLLLTTQWIYSQDQFNVYFDFGTYMEFFYPKATIQTIDGGYLTAGNMDEVNSGWGSYLMVKQSPEGNLQWIKEFYMGTDDYLNDNCDLEVTNDGGIIFCGTTFNSGFISKLDVSGEAAWSKSYTYDIYPNYGNIKFDRTIIDPSGEMDIFGITLTGIILLKLNENGQILQQVQIDFDGYPACAHGITCFVKSEENIYIRFNYFNTDGNCFNYIILKLNQDYSVAWAKVFEDSEFDFTNILVKTNGNIMLTGNYADYPAICELESSTGDPVWTKLYLANDVTAHYFGQSILSSDNMVMITGCAYNGNNSVTLGTLILNTDDNGDFISAQIVNPEDYHECGANISITNGGSYIVNGNWYYPDASSHGFYVMDISKEGMAACFTSDHTMYDSIISFSTVPLGLSDINIYTGNVIEQEFTMEEGFYENLSGIYDGCITTNINIANTKEQSLTISPNPNNGKFNVEIHSGQDGKLIITRLMGTRVYSVPVSGSDSNIINIDLNIPPGIYFVEFTTIDKMFVQKMIIH